MQNCTTFKIDVQNCLYKAKVKFQFIFFYNQIARTKTRNNLAQRKTLEIEVTTAKNAEKTLKNKICWCSMKTAIRKVAHNNNKIR